MTQRPAAHQHPGYVPAAGHDFLLPFYDPMLRLLLRERVLRNRFLDLAAIESGQRVLDIGCGTGTLLLLLRERDASVEVIGIDGDPKALAIAAGKAAKRGATIRFEEALAMQLPFAAARFDRVLSSLMLHHLTDDEKLAALREAHRVLAPGGSFHLVDFSAPRTALARIATHVFHHDGRMEGNLEGRIPALLREAGFARVEERGYHNSLLGTFAFISAWT
jgi:ubiquinone/menaquinone biosynthesis C-methylase UbiE